MPAGKQASAVVCSPACRHSRTRRLRNERRALARIGRKCDHCGGPIPDDRRNGSKFCSQICYRRADAKTRDTTGYMRQYLYGVTPERFLQMRAEQGGRCAVCRSDEWRGKGNSPHVDHDHVSGAVRGLLCGNCNNGLGNFGDDPARLRAAAAYVEAGTRQRGSLSD